MQKRFAAALCASLCASGLGASGLALVGACTGAGDSSSASSDTGDATSGPSTGAGPGCKFDFVGDASKPVEFTVVVRGGDPVTTDLEPGGAAPMMLPPQGGRVILVGVRATNLDPCGVDLLGSVRDPATAQVRIDQRTTNLRVTADGFAESVPEDMSTFANVPTCPNQWASTDLYGKTFELGVVLTDRDGRTASQTFDVVPFCSEPAYQADCECQCQAGYMLGQECPTQP